MDHECHLLQHMHLQTTSWMYGILHIYFDGSWSELRILNVFYFFWQQAQSTQEGATENDRESQIYSKGDFYQLFGAKTRKIIKITLLG
jgi:transketolase N-terminal domain/subunit